MSLLVQRGELNPLSPSHRREIEAGGRWVAFGQPDPDELVAEITARGVRSLVTFQSDLSFLRRVPQVEFLVVSSDPKDVAPIHDLPNLRSLHFTGTWGGRLDFTAFPKLESFEIVECPKDGGGLDTLFAGHPVLESLAIGRYRHDDLTPLGGLQLRTLALSGRLSSLDGAEALAPTLQRLSLDAAPNLAKLDGIELLSHLEIAEIDGLRHITTVEWAAGLPRLRLLDVFDQKGIGSLWPLADRSVDRVPHVRPGQGPGPRTARADSEPQAVPDRPLPLEPGPRRVPLHASSAGRRSGAHGVLLAQARLRRSANAKGSTDGHVGRWSVR